MPKKRRSSSVNLIETENLPLPNLPPWYVRVLIYSVVVFCFVLVFTLGPDSLENTNEDEHIVRDHNGKVKTTNDAPYPPKIVSWNDISPNENLAHLCHESGTKPEFIICSSNNDHQMKTRNNFFSAGLIDNFQETLTNYPNAGLLDVGANEGFFTLFAAKLGRNAISVEPFEDNILLIQDSARRNEFTDKIILIQNAVSNKYEKIPFSGSVGDSKKEDQRSYQHTIYVESITLENIMSYVAFNDIIIRIDIGGDECTAFERSEKLFKLVNVVQIFMEWDLSIKKFDENCVENMLNIFKQNNLRPFSLSGIELQPNDWKSNWAKDYIVWKK